MARNALRCPRCNSATPPTPVEIEGRGVLLDRSDEDEVRMGAVRIPVHAVGDGEDVLIVRCQACGGLLVCVSDRHARQYTAVWPLGTVESDSAIPADIRGAFDEARLCLSVGARGGCLLMARTTLVRIQREQGTASLKAIFEKGHISRLLYEQADEVRLWANVVGHEDFDPSLLTQEACAELIAYLGALVDTLYIQPAALAQRREERKAARSGEESAG